MASPIPVAADSKHGQFGIGQLGARGVRQHAAMQRVHTVGVEVVRSLAGASDAAKNRHLVGPQPEAGQCLLY